jgi:S1-C subfamily serine protease
VEALRRRTADSRVSVALAKIAAEDADPQMRELAAKPLGPEETGGTSATGPLPPRLGVQTEYVKAAPNVPDELVGKLTIAQMGTGFPADRAGMKEGDVLLEIGGRVITSGPQLIEVLDSLPKNVDIDVLISRNGQTMRLTARF